MDTLALYDFSPLLRLMLLGVTVAMGPLAWVWLRNRQGSQVGRLAALTTFTLFLTFDLVLFGAFTRLTDSGLGCPDWPGCYGNASPWGASHAIAQAQQAMPTGPVTFSKAWVEMIHRYLATAVGVLILVLAWVGWRERKRLSIDWRWPLLTLVWVCLQGAFGALTVTMKLFPAIVTLHLLGGMVLLALLRYQAVRLQPSGANGAGPLPVPLRSWIGLLFGLVWLQMALGGWVSTNYAVLACQDFPTCQGGWWPDMDWRAGFEIWRGLGQSGAGEGLPFAALTAIHYGHRMMAYVVLVALVVVGWRMHGFAGQNRRGKALLVLAAWQLGTGMSNVVLDWPLIAAVGHTAGAAAMVVVLTGWLAQKRPVASVARQPHSATYAHSLEPTA
jgi:heme a synthase